MELPTSYQTPDEARAAAGLPALNLTIQATDRATASLEALRRALLRAEAAQATPLVQLITCQWCGSRAADDMRGNCGACGGPRADSKATEPVVSLVPGSVAADLAQGIPLSWATDTAATLRVVPVTVDSAEEWRTVKATLAERIESDQAAVGASLAAGLNGLLLTGEGTVMIGGKFVQATPLVRAVGHWNGLAEGWTAMERSFGQQIIDAAQACWNAIAELFGGR